MNPDRLLDLIASHFGRELSQLQVSLAPERAEQYARIFNDPEAQEATKVVQEHSPADLHKITNSRRLQRVVDANPSLAQVASRIKISSIEANKEATKTVRLPDNQFAILLDTHTMLFLWMMNKAYLYGQSQLDENDQFILYGEIFLHFSTLRYSEKVGGVYRRPKTPPHRNKGELNALAIFTELQETFLLCHELAHIYIEINGVPSTSLVSSGSYDLDYRKFFPSNLRIDEELLADELAFEWTLQTLDRTIPEVVEILCVAIFLMIRYFMWLRIVHTEESEESEHHLWFARNTFFREKFRKVYTWSEPTFIVEIFDHLEGVLEPASLQAAEFFSELMKAPEGQ